MAIGSSIEWTEATWNPVTGCSHISAGCVHVGLLPLDGIDWVIVGGESGSGARPMKREWVLSIKSQCEIAGAAFYFKQWGGTRKHLNGRVLDGKVYDAMPITAELSASGLLELEPSVAVRD